MAFGRYNLVDNDLQISDNRLEPKSAVVRDGLSNLIIVNGRRQEADPYTLR